MENMHLITLKGLLIFFPVHIDSVLAKKNSCIFVNTLTLVIEK